MLDQEELEPANADAAEEQMNESILDLFETSEEVEDFALAVCW